jgi:glutathione S-transferase
MAAPRPTCQRWRVLRVHRIPHSTNVERVALALGHKGLDVEWVDHDPADRTAIRTLSGQDLVPVMELDGEVVTDSSRIVERIERYAPDPPLYPRDPAQLATVDVFIQWFDEVWKRPPNEIEAELGRSEPDRARIAALAARMAGWQLVFERLLSDRDYLFGPFGAADVCAFPFLRYATGRPPGDDEPFHIVLEENLGLEGSPRLRDWIDRMAQRPVP